MQNTKRQQWWANLSTKERGIRLDIKRKKEEIKQFKEEAADCRNYRSYARTLLRINLAKATIRALKHELQHGSTTKVQLNKSGFFCGRCKQSVKKFDHYCPMCGQKLDWSVAREQYEHSRLLSMVEGFLNQIKCSDSNNQKLYCLDRATEVIDALKAKYEKKVQC